MSVDPVGLPPDVGAGAVVDVYLPPQGRCAECSGAALSEVTVVTVPPPDELTGTQQVVLAVEQADVDRWFSLLADVSQPTVTVLARG